ncbi:MAG: YodC family protein [Rhabdaerophilum sp.]
MFKIGDVVQVKSGGPAMTVLAVGDEVECVWYGEESETFRREKLPAILLEAVEFEEEDDNKNSEEDEEDEDQSEDEDEQDDEDQDKAA